MIRNKCLFYLLSFTWGLPLTLVGCVVAIVLLITGHKPKKWGYCYYFEIGKNWGGLELGPFFLVNKDASNHITQIIEELNVGTKQANISIEESAQSVNEQNSMIQNTQKRFEDINRDMHSLSKNIQEAEESMKPVIPDTSASDLVEEPVADKGCASSMEGITAMFSVTTMLALMGIVNKKKEGK